MDWLSQLLQIITVSGALEVRRAYGAPWRISYEQSPQGETPYHLVLCGSATLENADSGWSRKLDAGDIVLVLRGQAHVLHDGSGLAPSPIHAKESADFTIVENSNPDSRLDMLRGRFFVMPPHDRVIHEHLPDVVVVRTIEEDSSPMRLRRVASLPRSCNS